MSDEQPLLLIGNPDNRRTKGLQEARQQIGLKPAMVIPYKTLLHTWRQGGSLSELVRVMPHVPLIRLDAPGEDWDVERGLLHLGATSVVPSSLGASEVTVSGQDMPDVRVPSSHLSSSLNHIRGESFSAVESLTLEQQWGRIYAPAQWFRGWKACLDRIEREAREVWSDVQFWNHPADIGLMFDKRECQRHLSRHGVYVPPILQFSEPICNYDTLHSAMTSARMHRVFVKLAYGSGASGVVAYQINPRTGAEIAITTMGLEQTQQQAIFYNEGRLRRYTCHEEIRTLMNWLCAEGAQIERWMPKATLDQRAYDIRQLVAGGQAGHAVMRLSRSPITNLHLRNERMLPAEAGLDEQRMALVRTAAMATMSAFPHSWSAGIDVMLTGGMNSRAYILDVNPFGDLLYRVKHQGLGTYEWEMDILRKEPIQHA